VTPYRIQETKEFSALVAGLSEEGRAALGELYVALARSPLPGESLLTIERYPLIPNAHTVPFRGGLLVYLVLTRRRVIGMLGMIGVEP